MAKPSLETRPPVRISIKAVAEATGLGKTTISDIMNRGAGDKYSEGTRLRVEKAVRDLGYTPSRAAQHLKRGRSGQIGLLLTRSFSNPLWTRLADSVQRAVAEKNYRLQMAVTDGDPDRELDWIRSFCAEGVEGLIVAPIYEQKDVDAHRNLLVGRLPVVLIGAGELGHYDLVSNDREVVGQRVLEHLIGLGHERVAFLSVPDAVVEASSGTRFAGARDLLRQRGFYRPELVYAARDSGCMSDAIRESERFVERWRGMAETDRPTAVVCHRDQVAIALLGVAHRVGIRVPGDLSVVGCDNLDESACLVPPLTTIDTHYEKQVEVAIELLLKRIKEPGATHEHHVVASELIVRASTSPPGE